MPERLTHLLRSDAMDNRNRVLRAARSLFSERGLDVPLREVARHVEVGPATPYRRIPPKQALIDEVSADELKFCRGIVEDGSADLDPWQGFCSVIEGLSVLQVRSQGFVDAFISTNREAMMFTQYRASAAAAARRARRTRAAGQQATARLRD